MTDEKDFTEVDEETTVVEMVDAKGNTTYFYEEMIVPVGNKNFAILVETSIEEDESDAVDDEDENVIVARVDFDKDGEPVYVDPTDEEYEEFQKAYAALMQEEDTE